MYLVVKTINEPVHDKTYKMACVPSKVSDQPGHPPSLISLHCTLGYVRTKLCHVDSKDSDQTGQMLGAHAIL